MSTDLRELFEQAIALAKTYEEKIEYLEKDLKSAKERSRRTEDMRANVQAKYDELLADCQRMRQTASAATQEANNWKERALNTDREVVTWKERALQAESKQGSLAAQAILNFNAILEDKKMRDSFYTATIEGLRKELRAAQERITELEAAALSWQTRCENAEAAEHASKTNLNTYIEELKRNTYRQSAVIDAMQKENAALRNGGTLVGTAPVVEQWEPKLGPWYISQGGTVRRVVSNPLPNTAAFGVYRDTEDQARGAAAAMRAYNRLLAYRDKVEPNFYQVKGDKYYWVYYDVDGEVWDVQPVPESSRQVHIVYFANRVCAESLAKKLNSGEVVL